MNSSSQPNPDPACTATSPAEGCRWKSRALALLLVGLTVAVLVGFMFVGWRWMRGSVSAQTTSYTVVSPQLTSVDFVVRAPSDARLHCEVRVQGKDGLDVGIAEVTIDMQGQKRRTQRVEVPTRRTANSGQVSACSIIPAKN